MKTMTVASISRNRELPMRRKALFLSVYLLFVALVLAAGAEVVLRVRGIQPWRRREIPIQVKPGDKFFMKHPALGYSHIAGQFSVSLRTGYSFRVTHLPSTLRITRPLETYEMPAQKEQVWIFGCSYTHGFSLNDEETYPWLLQERFPEYEVVNFGVDGYGTVHSLIQFREALKTGRAPRVAVLAYASFHDARNTFLRTHRKNVALWNHLGPLVQPYARLDRNGKIQLYMADVVYSEFPLMTVSALAHFIETEYDQYEEWLERSHSISKALVKEMARLAKEHGVEFIVAGISHLAERPGGKWDRVTAGDNTTVDMLRFAEANGIPSVDISVDERLRVYNNLPHNGHPSAPANKEYADKLGAFLRARILSK